MDFLLLCTQQLQLKVSLSVSWTSRISDLQRNVWCCNDWYVREWVGAGGSCQNEGSMLQNSVLWSVSSLVKPCLICFMYFTRNYVQKVVSLRHPSIYNMFCLLFHLFLNVSKARHSWYWVFRREHEFYLTIPYYIMLVMAGFKIKWSMLVGYICHQHVVVENRH